MEKIKINDKEYVLVSDVNKEYVLKSELKNKKGCFEVTDITLLDNQNVLGVGSVTLEGDWNITKISIPMLKRAIKICEEVHYSDNPKDKRPNIVVACSDKYPLCLGDKNKDSSKFSGVIIAPISDVD